MEFLEQVNELRDTQNKAFSLKENVEKLIEDVETYKQEWLDLTTRHNSIKARVSFTILSKKYFF